MGHRWLTTPDSWRDSMAVEATPTWKGIVATADEHNASLIVLGPHRRSGLLGHLQGSVAAAVVAHSSTPVLLVPEGLGLEELHAPPDIGTALSAPAGRGHPGTWTYDDAHGRGPRDL